MPCGDPMCAARNENGVGCILLMGHRGDHDYSPQRLFTMSDYERGRAEGRRCALEEAISICDRVRFVAANPPKTQTSKGWFLSGASMCAYRLRELVRGER